MIDFIFSCQPSRKRKDGTVQVFIKASRKSESIMLGTNVYVLPEHWQDGRVVNHPNAQKINTELSRQLYELQSWSLDQIRKDKKIQLAALHNYKKSPKQFVQFANSVLQSDHLLSYNTKKRYRVMIGHVSDFDKSILIDSIDVAWMEKLDAYLMSNGMNNNSRITVFKGLQRFLNMAADLGLIDLRDVPKYSNKIKEIESDRCALTENELHRIESIEFSEEFSYLEKIKDMFLFSCYTGLRFQDLQALTARNFREGNDGLELHFRAKKTGKLLTLPLQIIFDSKPYVIVQKYLLQITTGKELDKNLFKKITNQYANRCMREIALKSKIFKKVTMHVGRHTFATTLATKIPTKILQELMQHSKIETTMIYVHMSNQHITDELKKVFK